MSNLRDLLIGIGFQFDDGTLQSANDATDNFVSSIETGDALASNLGSTFDETTSIITGGMDTSANATDVAANSVADLGNSAEEAGKSGQSAFGEFATAVTETSATVIAAASLIGTAFVAETYNAASALEYGRARLKWYVADNVEAYETIQTAIADTSKLTEGLFAEGEILNATNAALKLGLDPTFLAQNMDALSILSVKHGESLENMFLQVGRAVETGSVRQLMEMGVVTEDTFAQMGKAVSRSITDWTELERQQLINTALQDVMANDMDNFGEIMETNTVQMQRFKSELGNIVEYMGMSFLEPAADTLEWISHSLQWIQAQSWGPDALGLAGWVGVAAAIITTLAGVLKLVTMVVGAFSGFAALFAEGGALYGAWTAITGVIAALGWEILVIIAIVAGLIFIFQDVYTYLKGGDSLIGRFEQKWGLLGKAIVRGVFPIIGAVEAFRELYSVLQDLYTMATELGISGILAEIGITTDTGVPGTTGINTGEAPLTGTAAISSRLNGIKNDFQSNVTVSVSGTNASPEEIGAQVETAMSRSFDTMMDKHMKRMSSVS